MDYTWRYEDREKGNSQKRDRSLAEMVTFGKYDGFKAKNVSRAFWLLYSSHKRCGRIQG